MKKRRCSPCSTTPDGDFHNLTCTYYVFSCALNGLLTATLPARLQAGFIKKGKRSARYRWRHQETGVWRESDASQPGVSREQVSDLGKPRKNSTIRHPDAQIPAESQEAQKQPRRRGQNYRKSRCCQPAISRTATICRQAKRAALSLFYVRGDAGTA